jgi:hypothetical protein
MAKGELLLLLLRSTPVPQSDPALRGVPLLLPPPCSCLSGDELEESEPPGAPKTDLENPDTDTVGLAETRWFPVAQSFESPKSSVLSLSASGPSV